MADQTAWGQHSCLVHFWQVAFEFTPTPALPRCPSNKINTALRSKEKPSRWKLMHRFHLWFVLACSITHYGKCPCMGKLSPVTLRQIPNPSGATPKFYKARAVPYTPQSKVEAKLDCLERDNIERVQFSNWAAPIVPVIKRDGCQDLWW